MNKTVTINLSGIVFHIDENAYEALRKYMENLKQHFSGTQGKEEIIADIESRFAEMFSEKVNESKNVITLADVNGVIEVMGKPEQVAAADEEVIGQKTVTEENVFSESARKRFFRNPDDKILGGVCSGISAYFNFDPLWLRLAFAISIIFAGTGLLIYLILWIIIPKANSATEKLQMRGEKVNLANIQRSVKEELEGVKKKGESFGEKMTSQETQNKIHSASSKFGSFLADVGIAIGKFIATIFGLIITLLSMGVLIGLTVTIFSGIGILQFAISPTITNMVLSQTQIWWLVAGGLLAIGIPFTLLLLNGLKLLFKVKLNLKMIGTIMAGFWLIGLGICIIAGIRIASEYKYDASVKHQQIITNSSNTLILKGENHWKSNDDHIRYGDIEDMIVIGKNGDSVVAPFVRVDIQQSHNDSIYLIQKLSASGNSYEEARLRAEEIMYSYQVSDSTVTIPDFFIMNPQSKYRGQCVELTLMLPVGKSIQLDKSIGWMLYDVENLTDTWDGNMPGHIWKMEKEGLSCIDCPEDFDKGEKEWYHDGKRIHAEPGKVTIEEDGKRIEITKGEIKVDSI